VSNELPSPHFWLPVQDLTQELEADSARAELALDDRPSEATGYSDAWDLAEAFRDAIDEFSPAQGLISPMALYVRGDVDQHGDRRNCRLQPNVREGPGIGP
jgi:hypothetical protein